MIIPVTLKQNNGNIRGIFVDLSGVRQKIKQEVKQSLQEYDEDGNPLPWTPEERDEARKLIEIKALKLCKGAIDEQLRRTSGAHQEEIKKLQARIQELQENPDSSERNLLDI